MGTVTVVIQPDIFAEEIGWSLTSMEDGMIMEVPFGTYMGNETIYEKILAPMGRYNFTLVDSYGDGLTDGFYSVYLGDDLTANPIISGIGYDYTYKISHFFNFYGGTVEPIPSPTGLPSYTPTPTPPPSPWIPYPGGPTAMPTAAPTDVAAPPIDPRNPPGSVTTITVTNTTSTSTSTTVTKTTTITNNS